MEEKIWNITRGKGPIVATAIHDGHEVRDEVLRHMALDEAGRLREEDPFSARWTEVAPTRVVGLRSRFEVDLNRPRDKAVYRTPEDAWGLKVWTSSLPEEIAFELSPCVRRFLPRDGGRVRRDGSTPWTFPGSGPPFL